MPSLTVQTNAQNYVNININIVSTFSQLWLFDQFQMSIRRSKIKYSLIFLLNDVYFCFQVVSVRFSQSSYSTEEELTQVNVRVIVAGQLQRPVQLR